MRIAQSTGSTGELNVSENGILNVSGGELWIGNNGTGTLNQIGGTVESPNIYVGKEAKASGVWNISGGEVLIGTRMEVGASGTGTMNITGGTVKHTGNRADRWLVFGQSTGSKGTLNMSAGTLDVDDLCIANNGTAEFHLSGGDVTGRNWYLLGFGSGNGKTIQTGGTITTSWFITSWGSGIGTLEMYGGNLISKDNTNGASLHGRTGTGHLNMYGGNASFVNLETGANGGSGHFLFSGGTMSVSSQLSMKNASTIQFVAGPRGFGSLEVGTYTDSGSVDKEVTVSGRSGLTQITEYDQQNGKTFMTTNAGKPSYASTDDLYTIVETANGNGTTLSVKMSDDYFKGDFDPLSVLELESPSQKGWVLFEELTETNPYVLTLSVTGTTEDDIDAMIAALNDDLKLGSEEQIWTATEGNAWNEIVISGLETIDLSSSVFAWDFTDSKYASLAGGLAVLALSGTVVPEPTSCLLLLGGALGIWVVSRRKVKKSPC